MSPVRIQRRRTKGWRMPEGAKYVGRPSRWGNPFLVHREECSAGPGFCYSVYSPRGLEFDHIDRPSEAARRAVELFELHIGPFGSYEYDPDQLAAIDRELRGHDLACWCPLDQPCHADVLLRIANGGAS